MTFKPEIVFVRLLPAFLAGILAGYFWPSYTTLKILSALLPSLWLLLVILNLLYAKLNFYRYKTAISLFYFLAFFLSAFATTLQKTDFIQPNYYASTKTEALKAVIVNEPQSRGGYTRFEAVVTQFATKNQWKNARGKLLVTLKADSLSPILLNYGTEIIFVAKTNPTNPPYNPAEFDFKKWLANKNITRQVFVQQQEVVITAQNRGNPFISYALNLRKKQVAIYRKLIKDDEAFAVASTLILGYRADLSPETLAAYSKTGTIHALSVSGMHVGLVYLVLSWLLAFMDRQRGLKAVKFILIFGLIWYYTLITGLSASVLRSAIMISVYMISKYKSRRTNPYNVLSLTALCLLAYEPLMLWDVGFQLSFLAVLGLIYLQPKIYAWIYIKNKPLDMIWGVTAMSLSAQLATLPLSIYYFHQFPVYFLVANLFIWLPITALMYTGLSILVLHLHFLSPAFEWLIIFVNTGLKHVAQWPFAGINSIWINNWQLLLLSSATLLIAYAFTNYHKKILFWGLTCLICYQLIATYNLVKTANQTKFIAYSLRKNSAYAFIKGSTAVLLTDLNDQEKTYKYYVYPSLDAMQIKKIVFINWSHPYNNNFIKKENYQISFAGRSFLLMDKKLAGYNIKNQQKFDFVLLSDNPKIDLHHLYQTANFNKILIDASNTDYHIKTYLANLSTTNVVATVLKNNPALQIDLK